MSFRVEGDYFEACSCSVSCPCIFLSPATTDDCDLFFAWNTQPLRQAKSQSVRFAGDWSFSAEETSGFITEFAYEG